MPRMHELQPTCEVCVIKHEGNNINQDCRLAYALFSHFPVKFSKAIDLNTWLEYSAGANTAR